MFMQFNAMKNNGDQRLSGSINVKIVCASDSKRCMDSDGDIILKLDGSWSLFTFIAQKKNGINVCFSVSLSMKII